MKKIITLLSIMIIALIAAPAYACWGEACESNVESHVSGSFGAYDSDSFSAGGGRQGANAFADGYGAGDFAANSYGDKFAKTTGFGKGNVDVATGAAHGSNWVAVGSIARADSQSGALAVNDGGIRNAYAATYGSVYQNNSAYTNAGPGTYAAGGNQSGASYYDSDSESYKGSMDTRTQYMGNLHGWGRLNWRNYERITIFTCRPGEVDAYSAGSAMTAGGTVVYARNYRGGAVAFGATGSFSVGNSGVWGNGGMETGAFTSDGMSGAGINTSGAYNYSGTGFGAGATFGGGTVSAGAGSASAFATHTSIATGSNGGQQNDNNPS